jgi:hypothetical protein
MSLIQISRGPIRPVPPSGLLSRLDLVELSPVFRDLPQVFERQRSLDALAQITAIEGYPSPQQLGAVLFHAKNSLEQPGRSALTQIS